MSTLIALDMSTNPPTRRELQCDTQARLVISGGGGTSDTTEATQLAVKIAVQSIDAKMRPLDASPATTKEAVIASDGAALNLASLAQSIVRNADGSVSYVEVVSGGSTYRQTLTYTSGAVTGVSAWVKQ